LLGKALSNYQITIFASDLDEDALTKAVKGEYNRKQLRGLKDSLIDKYFSNNGASYQVKDFVRQLIRFEKHDLMKRGKSGSLRNSSFLLYIRSCSFLPILGLKDGSYSVPVRH
jgi:chemotaxis methyl-accepting protein methylase